MHTDRPLTPAELLRWYSAAGVEECIGEQPMDRYAQPAKASARPLPAVKQPAPTQPGEPSSSAHLALGADSLEELKAAMLAYDGCGLKRTCQSTVFADGNPQARLMIVGEAPGADEDRIGLPFVGASGKLLDAMLAAIGLDRTSVFICNVVPWRPPGNRKPEPAEVELCLPFVSRQIELVDPAVLLLLGGAPTSALLARTDSITRLRGHWIDYQSKRLSHPIPAMPTFHPAYLLRTPAHKKEAWRDMLAVKQRLDRIYATANSSLLRG
jgi:DNA polymerase